MQKSVNLIKNGRVLLPSQLRKDVNLEKAIRVVGQGNKLEIWAEGVWLEKEEADQAVILKAFEAGGTARFRILDEYRV